MSEEHSPYLHHHFDTLEQQRQASSLGMWVFIAQEIMFFGGLFLGYAVYRTMYPEAFALGSDQLSVAWGGFNTVVLICSSLTVALSVRAAQLGDTKAIMKWIWATMLLGTIFLGVKYIEYSAKWEHHLVPGKHFHFEDHHAGMELPEAHAGLSLVPSAMAADETEAAAAPGEAAEAAGTGDEAVAHAEDAVEDAHGDAAAALAAHQEVDQGHLQIFFSFYFAMTGMHALHMVIGIGLMFWLLRLAANNRFAAVYYSPVENFGLYWHFVDIIWIFLFPLLYLI